MKHHNLKSFPDRFQALWEGKMVGENRYNKDRGFQEGDTVTLIEGTQEGINFIPTGRVKNAIISYVDSFPHSEKDYVTVSYKNVGVLLIKE